MMASAYLQPRLLPAGEVAPGVDDDRHPAVPRVLLDPLEQVEAGHLRQLEVEHHAVDVVLVEDAEGLLARRRLHDVDVAVVGADQVDDRLALAVVVLDDEQAAHPPVEERADLAEGGGERVGRDRAHHEGEGARGQHELALLLAGDDVHRDVAGLGLALERLEHGEAVDAGQVGVEDDGVGPQLAGEGEAAVAPVADEHLEARARGRARGPWRRSRRRR